MGLKVSFRTQHDKELKKGVSIVCNPQDKKEAEDSTHTGVLSVKSSLRLKSRGCGQKANAMLTPPSLPVVTYNCGARENLRSLSMSVLPTNFLEFFLISHNRIERRPEL